MKMKDLQSKTEHELGQLLTEERTKLHGLRFQDSERQLKNVRTIRTARKTIAQILTLLGSKAKTKA
ncbi:MAG TPA: 50S ribosomal protein L29 [Candidatus Kapabacteria bacterium]|nr:50S ribosomal protein L29 [Candidatus Kapabacteria bacterium]